MAEDMFSNLWEELSQTLLSPEKFDELKSRNDNPIDAAKERCDQIEKEMVRKYGEAKTDHLVKLVKLASIGFNMITPAGGEIVCVGSMIDRKGRIKELIRADEDTAYVSKE